MESSKIPALLLILMFSISSSFHIAFSCDVCPTPTPTPTPKRPKSPKGGGIITLPPIIGKPPINLPPVIPVIGKPPVTLPPIIGKPPILPPIIPILPPIIGKPPILPPITPILPPIIGKPPKTQPPVTGTPGCPPPPAAQETCPVDTLKLGACLDLLGNVVSIGDPVVNQCCPLIEGISGLEAALCLCTTIKLKLLNINLILPIALQLLATCGNTPPPGYTCP